MSDSVHNKPQAAIRVLIVDDQPTVRSALKFFLLAFDTLEPVGEAGNGEDALELCGEIHPDVVLMDLLVPGMGAANATRAIRQRFPHTQVIALASFWNEEAVQEVLDAGAIGYLLKNVSAEELADTIRKAHTGHN